MKTLIRLSLLLFISTAPVLAGSISTSTNNGETRVVWNGKEVFRGQVEGGVMSKSSTVNGKEMAAVISGDKVVWESEPGAAAAMKAAGKGPDLKMKQLLKKNAKSQIEVKVVDGETTVRFKGKEVWKGKTDGAVRGMAQEMDGEIHAAAFEGEKVIWENVKGAGAKLKNQKVPAQPLRPVPLGKNAPVVS